jgi:hypothetical protein
VRPHPTPSLRLSTTSAWGSGLGCAPSCFIAHEFDGPGVRTRGGHGQPNRPPSMVGKLVAISMQWDSPAEDCEVKHAVV